MGTPPSLHKTNYRHRWTDAELKEAYTARHVDKEDWDTILQRFHIRGIPITESSLKGSVSRYRYYLRDGVGYTGKKGDEDETKEEKPVKGWLAKQDAKQDTTAKGKRKVIEEWNNSVEGTELDGTTIVEKDDDTSEPPAKRARTSAATQTETTLSLEKGEVTSASVEKGEVAAASLKEGEIVKVNLEQGKITNASLEEGEIPNGNAKEGVAADISLEDGEIADATLEEGKATDASLEEGELLE